jgi:hypothetical protein
MNYISATRNLINNYNSITDDDSKQKYLKQLKIMMLNFRTLPPSSEKMNVEEFILARDIIELEMQRFLDKRDEKNFELAYLKAKQFYFDYRNILPQSPNMLYFLGIYLLHLLANNR